jgi:hypothetical protein
MERIETAPEEWTEQERNLIASLKEKGKDDPETMAELGTWLDVQEAFANMENTPRANIQCDIKRARLYRDAGFTEEAGGIFDSIREQLSFPGHENDQDLLEGL